jgi:polyisoprenyl-phosphate glycosyltransferase
MTAYYSVVIPVFNEAEVLPALYQRLKKTLEETGDSFEIIFVDDGSTDRSPQILRELRVQDPRVKLVSFSRNFGHQIAITAGLDYSSGDPVIVMDGDLQDPPEVIPQLVAEWRAGNEIVFAVRSSRAGEGLFKRATASIYYRILRRLTTTQIPVDAGDFRLMSRAAVTALQSIRERNRYVRGLVGWIGFRQSSINYARDSRYAGSTKYPITRMIKFALNGIFSFSFLPLQLATYLGFAVSLVSFIYLVYAIWLKLFTTRVVQGWASVMVAVLFVGGVQLVGLGIMGEYIGRIYDEVKQRPLYLVDSAAGFEQSTGDAAADRNPAPQVHPGPQVKISR